MRLIGENQREYGLRTGIMRVKGVVGRIHPSCSGQSMFRRWGGGDYRNSTWKSFSFRLRYNT